MIRSGDRVLLRQHAWAGHSGTVISRDRLPEQRKMSWRIRLDSGVECYADGCQIQVIE